MREKRTKSDHMEEIRKYIISDAKLCDVDFELYYHRG